MKGATPRDTKKLQRITNLVPSLTLIGCDFCLFRSSIFAFLDIVQFCLFRLSVFILIGFFLVILIS